LGKKLIVITGPTAVGKTDLCLNIAEHLDIPVINADSRQLFAELKIGTAAPTQDQLVRIHHYFVGTLHIGDYYSASMYEQQVMELLPKLFGTSTFALLAGGSMMYIDAVCNGIDDIPTIDEKTRATMKQRLSEEGLEALVEELKELDPEHYEIVDRKNPRRVVHALEICHMTGRTYTSFRKTERKRRPFDIIKIGLNREREELYQRIDLRVDQMMEEGLVEETKEMLPFRTENSLNTVGYKEIFNYLDGLWTLPEAIARIKGNTHRYARKQLTWFKRDTEMKWFCPDDKESIINYIHSYD
jgi:tRNA dimethylallyltransferase